MVRLASPVRLNAALRAIGCEAKCAFLLAPGIGPGNHRLYPVSEAPGAGQAGEAIPVERRAWIGLATGGDVAVADRCRKGGIPALEGLEKLGQSLVLGRLVGRVVGPL